MEGRLTGIGVIGRHALGVIWVGREGASHQAARSRKTRDDASPARRLRYRHRPAHQENDCGHR